MILRYFLRKENSTILKFTDEEKRQLILKIQDFFEEERDEKIGIIAAGEVLDFFIENIGVSLYNKSLDDAKRWFAKRMEDIEVDYDMLYK